LTDNTLKKNMSKLKLKAKITNYFISYSLFQNNTQFINVANSN